MGDLLPGGCLCGAVRFSARPQRAEIDACHCSMCRRWSGGVFLAVPCGEVAVEDEAALGVYMSSEWGERVFCRTCGTSLFWRLREGGDHLAVSAQSFDAFPPFAFTEEIFIDEKPAAYAFTGTRTRRTGAEVMAAFAGNEEA